MTVLQKSTVDWLGIEKGTGNVVLTVVDDLDWSDENGHLLALQEKLNTYLAFIGRPCRFRGRTKTRRPRELRGGARSGALQESACLRSVLTGGGTCVRPLYGRACSASRER